MCMTASCLEIIDCCRQFRRCLLGVGVERDPPSRAAERCRYRHLELVKCRRQFRLYTDISSVENHNAAGLAPSSCNAREQQRRVERVRPVEE